MAHYGDAASLLVRRCALSPSSMPAQLALADAPFESGEVEGARRTYESLTSGPSEPHARYGLGRARAAWGDDEGCAARAGRRTAAVSGVRRRLVRARHGRCDGSDEWTTRKRRWQKRSNTAHSGRPWTIRSSRACAPARRCGCAFRSRLRISAPGQRRQGDRGIRGRRGSRPEVGPRPRQPDRLYGRERQWSKAEQHFQALLDLGIARRRGTLQFCGVLWPRRARDKGGRAIPDGARDQSAVRAGMGRAGAARRNEMAASTRRRPRTARRPSRRRTTPRPNSISRA